jgi:hypothetical protein
MMMQSADFRKSNDLANTRWLDRPPFRALPVLLVGKSLADDLMLAGGPCANKTWLPKALFQ